MKKAVAYGRFSSDNQREESIDAQFRAIRKYAEQKGIEILDFYSDEALTGKNDARDGFQSMIREIIRGEKKVDFVLVHKFNRFARNKYDSTIYKKKLKDKNVKVVSVTQLVDDTPEGDLMEGFLEVMDEYYSANLSIEVKKGLRENALKGLATGIVPFGYISGDGGKYEIDEKNADIVRRIFTDFAFGISKSAICQSLNAEGYRNQFGRQFKIRSIGDMLKNEKYIGVYTYKLSNDEIIRLENAIPPIIEKSLWAKAQEMHRKMVKKRPNKVNTYHLTGRAFCSHCGCPISAGGGGKLLSNGDRLWYYECIGKASHKNGCESNKINKKWLEEAAVRAVLDYAFDGSVIDRIVSLAFKQTQEASGSAEETVSGLRSTIASITEKQKRVTLLYIDGNIDKSILDAENEKLKKEKFESELALERLLALNSSADITEEVVREFLSEYIAKLKETITKGDDSFIESLINTFIDKVIVGKETVEIHLKLDFHFICSNGCDNGPVAGALRNLPQLSSKRAVPRKELKFFGLVSILSLFRQ